VQGNPNTDTVNLNFYAASQQVEGLKERTYHRGLRELLNREFLFRSPSDGVFFVNIQFMFNGDRLAFVKGYKCKVYRDIGHQAQGQLTLLDAPVEEEASTESV
jgi:hypothetical protein